MRSVIFRLMTIAAVLALSSGLVARADERYLRKKRSIKTVCQALLSGVLRTVAPSVSIEVGKRWIEQLEEVSMDPLEARGSALEQSRRLDGVFSFFISEINDNPWLYPLPPGAVRYKFIELFAGLAHKDFITGVFKEDLIKALRLIAIHSTDPVEKDLIYKELGILTRNARNAEIRAVGSN